MCNRTPAGGLFAILIAVAMSGGCLRPRFGQKVTSESIKTPVRSQTPFAADKSFSKSIDTGSGSSVVQVSLESPATPARVPATAPLPAGDGTVTVPTPPVPTPATTAALPAPAPTVVQPTMSERTAPASTRLPYPASVDAGRVLVADPHNRQTPTVRGGVLNLAPDEQPMDRALELSRRLELSQVENKVLVARINILEARATEREQALNEAVRDATTASNEVMRTRVEMVAVRLELEKLRERVNRVEREELETLKTVINAIERLIQKQDEQQ
jgi:hypothetical protein